MQMASLLVVGGLFLAAVTAVVPAAQLPSTTPIEAKSASPAAAEQTLLVHLEGGNIPDNAAWVLKVLADRKALPVTTASAVDGDGVCKVYERETTVPGKCTERLAALGAQMSGLKSTNQILAHDTRITIPSVDFTRYQYLKDYDMRYDADRIAYQKDREVNGAFRGVEQKHQSFVTVPYFGYRLELPLSEAAHAKLLSELRGRQGVFAEMVTPRKPQEEKKYFSATQPIAFRPTWCDEPSSPEVDYSTYLGVDHLASGTCADPSRSCADIVLIDRPVSRHPEIVAALDRAPAAAAAIATYPKSCADPDQLGLVRYHGTHLAGIIASQQNGRLFAGLHPSARLVPLVWDDLGEWGTATHVTDRQDRPNLQIYVFTSQWELPADWVDPKTNLIYRTEYRTEKHRVAARIESGPRHLWVVAAGQPDLRANPKATPVPITARLNSGPMNLGDLRNVLVVGGCEHCLGDARFWSQGNYSREFVHLAAPADQIISTATTTDYTWARGTSQATAFVAGVASAMVSAYPSDYVWAEQVKQRLQYTARPFSDDDSNDKLASGIINPDLALKDPRKTYLRTTDVGGSQTRAAEILGWCTANLTMLHEGDDVEHGELRTRNVYRLTQVNSASGPEWVAFVQQRWKRNAPSVVLRVGPGVPVNLQATADPLKRPLLKTRDRVVLVEDVQELVIGTNTLEVVPCPLPKPS